MAEENPKKTLRQAFEELPLRVRDWLTSERATYFIIEINNRLGVDGETIRVIPRLILRLVVRDLEPNMFIHELAEEMEIPFSSAKVLAQEIEEKILRPIEAALRLDAGIDIKLIYLTEEKPASPIMEIINEESAPAIQTTPKPMPVVTEEKLIPSPEIAHPNEYRAPATQPAFMTRPQPTPAAPIQSPVYSPKPAPTPAPAPAMPPLPRVEPLPVRPPQNTAAPMPRVEPLPQPSSAQAPAQPTYVPKPTTMPGDVKKTSVPFKFEPSRVPKFPNNP